MKSYGFTKMTFDNGVRVFPVKNSKRYAITDNEKNIIFIIEEKRSLKDFIDEVVDENNECAECLGYFESSKTKKTYFLWYDWEIDEYYLTEYESVFKFNN